MDSTADLTLLDADSISNIDQTQTVSSTDIGKEAADRSMSDVDSPVQIASATLHSTKIIDKRLQDLLKKYEIPVKYVDKLRKLKNYEIVIICDDSGSMTTPIIGTSHTRWDELREIIQYVLEFGIIFDSNGIDIYFLNRPSVHKITNHREVQRLFDVLPSGYTPLTRTLRKVLKLPAARRGHDKKLLIFIATDGEPTNDDGDPDLKMFEHVIRHERQSNTTHIMFVICTDEIDSVNYLRSWDRTMDNIDVVDNFQNEKLKILSIHNEHYKFSKADYIIKILIGAIDREIDQIND